MAQQHAAVFMSIDVNEVEIQKSAKTDNGKTAGSHRDLGIGPTTSHLLATTFSQQALIGHEQAAQILGMTGKTLRACGDAGDISYRVKGSRNRTYSESDIIRFICGTTANKERKACPSINQRTRNSGNTISNGRVKGFMAQRANLASEERSRSKTG
tara:strand:- start:283 stop:750 length:468 start_codon:yes stop_codon:yes gene_type:complete